MAKKRIEELDILKGLAIIGMVLGHAGAPFTKFIFLFHMAVFFIASGYTYNGKSSDSPGNIASFVWKKIKRLWFPYFLWNGLFNLLHNCFIRWNILTDNPDLFTYTDKIVIMDLSALQEVRSFQEILAKVAKSALFRGPTHMGGALWFLGTLFLISILFCAADYAGKRLFRGKSVLFQGIVSAALLVAGYLCKTKDIEFWGLERVLSCYWLFFAGTLLNRYKGWHEKWEWKPYLGALAGSFLILLVLSHQIKNSWEVSVDLANNAYRNPMYFLLVSLVGWVFMYSLSYFLKKTPLKKTLIYLGENTLCIVILHNLCFKIVAAVVIALNHLPDYCLAALTHLYGDTGLWWLAYTVIGIAVPILLQFIYGKTKNLVKGKLFVRTV